MTDTLPASVVDEPATRRGLRFFAGAVDEPRARRAGDVFAFVSAVVGLAALGTIAIPPSRLEAALIGLLASMPGFLDSVWRLAVDGLSVMAVLVLVAAVVRRRTALVRDLVLGLGGAVALVLVAGRIVEGEWIDIGGVLRVGVSPWPFPAAHLALSGAVVKTAAPHLARPVRRIATASFWLAAASAMLLGAATPSRAVAGALVAVISASAIHLLFGSSRGRPTLVGVSTALAELGVAVTAMWVGERQPAGVFIAQAEDTAGRPLLVKVYGRDAHDTQLLATLWRTVWYRDPETPVARGRLHQVEHEALLTLLAARSGIPTHQVVTAAATEDSDALLVLRNQGTPLPQPSQRWSPGLLEAMWHTLSRLHGEGIAHGRVDHTHMFLSSDASAGDPTVQVGLSDFGGATLAAEPLRRRRDHAQLFFATVIGAGEDAAVEAVRRQLGDEGVAAMLPLLQTPVLTVEQRRLVRETDFDLDELRERVAGSLGIAAPALEKLRRVTLGSLLQLAFLVLAFVALAGVVGGVDLAAVGEQVGEAVWWLVVLGLVVAQVPRFAQAVSTLGACPVRLPLGLVYALQLAVSYVNLVIPGSAARIAVNVRFFQRQGLARGAALAVGGVDGFGSLVVQVLVISGLLFFTSASLDLDLDLSFGEGPGRLVLVVVLLAVLGIVGVLSVPSWRERIVFHVRQLLTEALSALRGLNSPRRLAMLFGGNLAADVMLALALGAFVRALGAQVGLGELIIIIVSVSLLAGLLPVPGGIGVTEGGLIYGLVGAGVPEEIAFAAVVMYRMASFYLPPIWGFFAFRWLERNEYL